MALDLTFDEVLTTTRAVRKRLDTTRPVPRAVLEECLDIALQAPNGSNRNEWRWIIVDDREMIGKLAQEYRAAMGVLESGAAPSPMYIGTGIPREDKLMDSALALPDKLLKGTPDDAPETNSELKFRVRDGLRESFVDPATGKRRGLRTAMRELKAGNRAA